MSDLVRTFSTRIDWHPALTARAELESRIMRKLHAALQGGRVFKGDLAVSFYQQFGISAKMLDGIHRQLKGRLAAVSELAKVQAQDIETRIEAKQAQIEKVEKRLIASLKVKDKSKIKPKDSPDRLRVSLHQHKRRLGNLREKLVEAKGRIDDPRLCFGTKKLFSAQNHLKANGYRSHRSWRKAWREARSSQFFVEGDARMASGNQFVRLTVGKKDTFNLELRLPKSLAHLAQHTFKIAGQEIHSITIADLRFAHGDYEIRRALEDGKPLSFRFMRHDDGKPKKVKLEAKTESEREAPVMKKETWTVSVSIRQEFTDSEANFSNGALGVDLNVDHVALTMADRCGNPDMTRRIDLRTYGKTRTQREDMVRKAAAQVAKLAGDLGVPVAAEKLDFRRKRAELTSADGARRARLLSSFAFAAFGTALARVCARRSIRLVLVNPAYTSLIGRVKFAPRYGSSVHAAAALSIARRAMGLSERLPPGESISVMRFADGDRVTLDRPARSGRRHVWSSWRKISLGLKAVLAERSRARRKARSDGASDDGGNAVRAGAAGRERASRPTPRRTGRSPPTRRSSGCSAPGVRQKRAMGSESKRYSE